MGAPFPQAAVYRYCIAFACACQLMSFQCVDKAKKVSLKKDLSSAFMPFQGETVRPPFFLFVLPQRKNAPRPVEERKGRYRPLYGLYLICASPSARGKSGLAPPVADEASMVFPQRSKNARISVSPMRFSGTARWRCSALALPGCVISSVVQRFPPF